LLERIFALRALIAAAMAKVGEICGERASASGGRGNVAGRSQKLVEDARQDFVPAPPIDVSGLLRRALAIYTGTLKWIIV
jgi:hypothetical protein